MLPTWFGQNAHCEPEPAMRRVGYPAVLLCAHLLASRATSCGHPSLEQGLAVAEYMGESVSSTSAKTFDGTALTYTQSV